MDPGNDTAVGATGTHDTLGTAPPHHHHIGDTDDGADDRGHAPRLATPVVTGQRKLAATCDMKVEYD